MGILASDTFNRSSSTLGGGWTEHGSTNMSCDGSFARIDASGIGHLATLAGTSRGDTYFQCWQRGSDGSNAVGLIWRFQDTSNYYLCRSTTGSGTSWGVFRVEGGVATQIGPLFGSIGVAGTWNRVAIRHVGTRIQVYLNQDYDINDIGGPNERDGPSYDRIDSDAQGSTWVGPCGLSSGGNNASGVTNIQWNDFVCFDGSAQTVYVNTSFNGGARGEGMGTSDRPDIGIDWALNNAGLGQGGKLKFQEAGPLTNPTAGTFKIGHATKFANVGSGYIFPTYDVENGSIVSAGLPNLTIEGMDAGRTVLREINAPSGASFFRLRADATGVVFRSLDCELTDTSSSFVRNNDGTGSTARAHDVQVVKCRAVFQDPAGTSHAILLDNATASERCEFLFNFFDCDPATLEHGEYIDVDRRVKNLLVKFNVFRGIAGAVPGPGAEISYGVVFGTSSDLQASDVADIDHNHFVEIFRGSFNEGAVGILDPAGMLGAIEFQNNIVAGPGAAASDPDTDFGVYKSLAAFGGTVTAHHNGYSLVDTPRETGVTNGGNELDEVDPVFRNPNATYLWPHTAGQGINGEGTSAAITLDRDWRPTAATYLGTADDSSPNIGVLDRGALQDFVPVGGFPQSIPASLPAEEAARVFCVSVIFDPGGDQEHDLSSKVLNGTALRYERDILLRTYRASDVTLEFMDPLGLFVEQNPDSFLNGPDGEPDWLGKRVIITAMFGTSPLTQYEGFVLEVEAGMGIGRLRIGNRFQQLFDRDVMANDVVRIEATNQAVVHPRTIGDTAAAGYIGRGGIEVHTEARAPVEVLTFEFTSPTDFFVTGTVSGFEGEGSIEANFTTLSGSVTVFGGTSPVVHSGTARLGGTNTIDLALTASPIDDFYNGMTITLTGGTGAGQSRTIIDYDSILFGFFRRATVDSNWAVIPDNTTTYQISLGAGTWNQGGHTYVDGERVVVTLGWASSMLQNPPSANEARRIVDIYRDFLLSPQGGQLVAGDLDASVAAMEGERNNQLAQPYVVDRPRRAIEVIDELSLHMGAVTIEKANAKIGLRMFTPQLIPAGTLESICSGDDLMEAETSHLPIYNQFVFSYEYDPATEKFRSGFVFPERGGDNPSLDRYGRLYPAPRPFEARAYSSAITDNTEWLQLLSEVLYRRYEDPALVVKVKTKVARMGAELDDTYRLDSDTPTMIIAAMEPFAIDKNITGGLTVDMELVDVSDQVQEEGACGFLSYDTPGQGYDQCWGYF